MNEGCLKLTTYSSERERTDRRFLADALIDLYAEHELETSVMLRGTEGFGLKHRLQTERMLSLSDDMPIVTVAVDDAARIRAALPQLTTLMSEGLVTLERAHLLTGMIDPVQLNEQLYEETRLTIYCGRQEHAGGRPAYVAIVELLHRLGLAGATVLLGVDGTVRGARRRGRFFGRNAEVPLMIIAIGSGETIAHALPELGTLLAQPIFTLERVRICKREGTLLTRPAQLAATDSSGHGAWQKLMVFAGEQSRHDGRTLYVELVHQLRGAGGSGATSLRGIWGYHDQDPPHGEKLLAIGRHVPVVTTIIDSPERIQRAFDVIDRLTDETGLVTSEIIPAFRARHADNTLGELDLPDREGA